MKKKCKGLKANSLKQETKAQRNSLIKGHTVEKRFREPRLHLSRAGFLPL